MLLMPAVQAGHPMAFVVLPKADDAAFRHQRLTFPREARVRKRSVALDAGVRLRHLMVIREYCVRSVGVSWDKPLNKLRDSTRT